MSNDSEKISRFRIKLEGDIVWASVDGRAGSQVDISPIQGGMDIRDPLTSMCESNKKEWMDSAVESFRARHMEIAEGA